MGIKFLAYPGLSVMYLHRDGRESYVVTKTFEVEQVPVDTTNVENNEIDFIHDVAISDVSVILKCVEIHCLCLLQGTPDLLCSDQTGARFELERTVWAYF